MINAKGKSILIISDLHLGDGSPADDFVYFEKKVHEPEESLIKWIEAKNPDYIVVAGDMADLWQFPKRIIKRTHKKVFVFLKSHPGYIRLQGNHDLGATIRQSEVFLLSTGKTLFVAHGHQNNPLMKNPLAVIGTFLIRWFERIIPNIEGVLEKWALSMGRGNGRLYDLALEYAKEQLKKYDYVVLGHTHKLEEAVPGYFNSGTSQHGIRQGVFVSRDGEVSLIS